MKNIIKIILLGLLGIFILYATINSMAAPEKKQNPPAEAALLTPVAAPIVKEMVPDIDSAPFVDNPDLYLNDDPSSVVYLYVTVRKGNPSDNSNYTWQEVNDFTKWANGAPLYNTVGKAEAIVQIGDENGPVPGDLGYGETVPNATIQIRGNSSTVNPQKSYKIELRSRAGRWRDQSTLNLNKHFWDTTRARNKLSFDLMKQLPGMVSLRTQYFRLFVKDETSDPPKVTFVDYGLYTQVEQPNRRFLRNHLLDQDGNLYKATFFEFFRYPDAIRLADDPLYDEAEFSKILEIKGNKNHAKLIQMLDDVNNTNIPIEQTFEKYFDENNYFTWLAINILLGNIDTQSQNFYLYSPRNGNKWYFIPWDYDGDLARLEQPADRPYDMFEYGVANYWGVPLHRRVLQVPRYRQMLDGKMVELIKALTPDKLNGMLAEYKKVTDQYSLAMPDLYYMPTKDEYEKGYANVPAEIQTNYDLYKESLASPMPFHLGTPKASGNSLAFNWDQSYDFDAQDITYQFRISTDYNFETVIYEDTLTNQNSTSIDMLEPGTYFWEVTATNKDGKTMYPFDVYYDADRIPHSGMKILFISNTGEVSEE